MKSPLLLSLLLMASFVTGDLSATAMETTPVYELRIYTTHPGKMPDLLKRFREHTCALFEKHGMVNVGYWLPADEKNPDKLYYVLKHASRETARASWQAFLDDPDWQAVREASEAAGRIVAAVDSTFLAATDYSPAAIPTLSGGHVFELRTYVCNEGRLDALDARFRDHTMKLFDNHGMINVLYTHPLDPEKGAGTTLIYFLAHASVDAAKASFDAFRADPEWIKVRDASEAAGKILAISPPSSVFLEPTDFSALQ